MDNSWNEVVSSIEFKKRVDMNGFTERRGHNPRPPKRNREWADKCNRGHGQPPDEKIPERRGSF